MQSSVKSSAVVSIIRAQIFLLKEYVILKVTLYIYISASFIDITYSIQCNQLYSCVWHV